MTSATIRHARTADLPAIIALDQALFGWYGADEKPETIRARLSVYPAGFFVAEVDGAVAGYTSTEKWGALREPALDEDPAYTHDPDGSILCITTLAVNAEYQGRKLGARLLDRLIGLARQEGCTQIVLETAHAAAFYTRRGFEIAGKREERGIQLQILRLRL